MKSGRRQKRTSAHSRTDRPWFQRCAVRVMYAQNSTPGQWRAHGRYIARENARAAGSPEEGFDEHGVTRDIATRLAQWQSAGDERLWKVIISPEFGERINLEQLTRELTQRMKHDLGTHLEWVAVCHSNTDNPHVHLALRGVRDNGKPLSLSRDYVKSGMRGIAEDLCTRQLGYRSEMDAIEAQRREVHQQRFTSLDRIIAREDLEHGESEGFPVTRDPGNPKHELVVARLRALEEMGLAESESEGRWIVSRQLATALRARQRAADRLKAAAAHGVTISDTRLPLVVTPVRKIDSLEGRVLSHDEDEATGRMFMLLEGTDARVHWLYHTDELATSRAHGGLRANSFIRLRKLFVDGRPLLEVDELGHAEWVLRDRAALRETALEVLRRAVAPPETTYNGWLGRYQRALKEESVQLPRQHDLTRPIRIRRRELGRSRGR